MTSSARYSYRWPSAPLSDEMKARTCGRVSLVQGGPNELERRRPALGASAELGDDGGLEAHLVGLAEQPLGLGGIEAQVVGAELRNLAWRPQAREADRWLSPAGEDERHPFGPRASSSRRMCRTSGESSTRWKSSNTSADASSGGRRARAGTCRARSRAAVRRSRSRGAIARRSAEVGTWIRTPATRYARKPTQSRSPRSSRNQRTGPGSGGRNRRGGWSCRSQPRRSAGPPDDGS